MLITNWNFLFQWFIQKKSRSDRQTDMANWDFLFQRFIQKWSCSDRQTDMANWDFLFQWFIQKRSRSDRQTDIANSDFLFERFIQKEVMFRQTWQSETSCFSSLFLKDYDLTEITQWIKKQWMQNLPEFLLITVLFLLFSLLDQHLNLLTVEAHAMKRWNIIEKR